MPDTIVPVIAPLTRIEGAGLPALPDNIDAVIFTSQNGVRFAPEGQGLRAYCVGDRTAAAAQARGYAAQSAAGSVDDLIAMIGADHAQTLVHLRGAHSTGNVAGTLRNMGHDLRDEVVYRAVAHPLPDAVVTALARGEIGYVMLFSPRAATLFADEIRPDWPLERLCAIAISPAAADPLRGRGFGEIRLADAPNAAAMRAALGPAFASALERGEPLP
nr:uroporphyrinogen-III synthase [Rubricella aquisinus]